MNENVINTGTNFFEKSCNDITKNIIGGFTSPVEKAITNNMENISKLIPVSLPKIIEGSGPAKAIKTSYIILGYEISSTVFIILMSILVISVLYMIYKLYKRVFSPKQNNFVSMSKFKPNHKQNDGSSNNSIDDEELNEELDEELDEDLDDELEEDEKK